MSPLSAILIPLQTLPGYPEAPAHGALDILWFVLLIPVVVAVIILALTMGRTWMGKDDAEELPMDALQGRKARENAGLVEKDAPAMLESRRDEPVEVRNPAH
ncbi:hypothetical protein [Nigerium massiliense]|uniref:hypothetical protein n=1 Tax=Nigerium massiliense TaxID=1522317 RepID=UPI00058EBAB1|nr:hypothetical protein [Nigerium massiliense]